MSPTTAASAAVRDSKDARVAPGPADPGKEAPPKPSREPWRRKVAFHGLAAEVECTADGVTKALDHLLGPFRVEDSLDWGHVIRGSIRTYNEQEVRRSVSATARPLRLGESAAATALDLYQEDERVWRVDERWGLTELNLLRGQWRSWVLPRALVDPLRLAEESALWPLAQVLRQRGLHLLPAASVVKRGWGVLILAGFDLAPELVRLVRAGYGVIGQRWTAVRVAGEEEPPGRGPSRVELLHVPGAVEAPPSWGGPAAAPKRSPADVTWLDLEGEFPGCGQRQAPCDLVVIVDGQREGVGRVNHLGAGDALEALRRAWPIAEVRPSPRHAALLSRLAEGGRCVRMQMPRDAGDLVPMLNSALVSGRPGELTMSLFGRWRYRKAAVA